MGEENWKGTRLPFELFRGFNLESGKEGQKHVEFENLCPARPDLKR